MPYNKGTLDSYSTIDTKYLKARTLSLTGSANIGGNLYVTGSISGSSIQSSGPISLNDIVADTITGSTLISGANFIGPKASITSVVSTSITGSTISGSTYIGNLVTSIANSGSADLISKIYVTGSGDVSVTQSGQIIMISGSGYAPADVIGIAASGSTLINGEIYFTGSGTTTVTQSGQAITFSGSADYPASYIICSGSGNYYARNCSTGLIDYTGSNAGEVIQSTINAVSGSGGGEIFFKPGLYVSTSSITINNHGIKLKGSGWGANVFSTPLQGTILEFQLSSNDDCIKMSSLSTPGLLGITIKDISICSRSIYPNTSLINIPIVSLMVVENLKFTQGYNAPIMRLSSAAGNLLTIRGCFFSGNNENNPHSYFGKIFFYASY